MDDDALQGNRSRWKWRGDARQSTGIELANHSNLGSRLRVPGVTEEGWLVTAALPRVLIS